MDDEQIETFDRMEEATMGKSGRRFEKQQANFVL